MGHFVSGWLPPPPRDRTVFVLKIKTLPMLMKAVVLYSAIFKEFKGRSYVISHLPACVPLLWVGLCNVPVRDSQNDTFLSSSFLSVRDWDLHSKKRSPVTLPDSRSIFFFFFVAFLLIAFLHFFFLFSRPESCFCSLFSHPASFHHSFNRDWHISTEAEACHTFADLCPEDDTIEMISCGISARLGSLPAPSPSPVLGRAYKNMKRTSCMRKLSPARGYLYARIKNTKACGRASASKSSAPDLHAWAHSLS